MKDEIQPLPIKNYDSEFCGSIPIQLINLIQPHGFVMLLDQSFTIVQVSENVKQHLHTEARQLLHHKFTTLLSPEQQGTFRKKLAGRKRHHRIPHVLKLKVDGQSQRFASTILVYPDHYLLEMEPLEEESNDITFIRAYQDIKAITTAMQEAEDIRSMSSIAAQEIKAFSGFDRVMIYRFDSAWNGTVIAEAQQADMEPYLGLTFPASDVPRQARELYFRNPYRLIPDINFEPARLFPVVNPIINGFTNLSECSLRGVPQVHVEYMNNMGVQASMSTPIIVDGQLWGLISCHHKSPNWVPFEMRYAFEVLSEMISSQVASRQRADRLTVINSKRSTELTIIDHIYRREDLFALLQEKAKPLLSLLEAGGATLMIDNQTESIGNTPEEKHIKELLKWLRLYKKEKIYLTNSLVRDFGKADAFTAEASGLLAIQFSHSPAAYLLLYRPEIIQTVSWGGNPNEAIQFEEDKKKYHPRNSFHKWQEEVRSTALPWEEELLNIAQELRNVLVERMLMDMQD
jgi:light-regulated signal transduction histidine kinase (bacteriophytochrome)